MIGEYTEQWNTPLPPNRGQRAPGLIKQLRTYLRLRRQVGAFAASCQTTPLPIDTLKEQVYVMLEQTFDLDGRAIESEVKGDYIACTKAFIQQAKSVCPKLDDASVFQALRNIWVMNLIQILHRHPVTLTPAMFGYSMLYPLTDNFIDDPATSSEDKKMFMVRFEKRLNGEDVLPETPHESAVWTMVAQIESQYTRAEHPEVFNSLLAIFSAQSNSLSQQADASDTTLLTRLTFEKGATSVLADAYLILGTLDTVQLNFFTGYGILLQLADDLQDLETDEHNGHLTLLSTYKTPTARSTYIAKLLRLSDSLMAQYKNNFPINSRDLGLLIEKSFSHLVADAVFQQKNRFSKGDVRQLSRQHFVSYRQHLKLHRYLGNFSETLLPLVGSAAMSRPMGH